MKIPANKISRHQAIREIVQKLEISSQAQLLSELKALKIEVTQATLSRDLDELNISKDPKSNQSVYELAHTSAAKHQKKKINLELIVGIDHSANIVVVKTPPGGAQFFASSVDNSAFTEIIGSIAGDDTVLLVTKKPNGGAQVAAQLWDLARSNR